MERVAVEVGVDRDRGDAELAAGAHDSDGDLAAVGDEDFAEQRGFLSRRPGNETPYPTAMPDPGRTSERAATVARSEHFAELDSTNRYAARRGARGRGGRASWWSPTTRPRAGGASTARWEAPPGSSLLVSVLLRPAPEGDASPPALTVR